MVSRQQVIIDSFKKIGNMWGQSWENIYSLTAPFPEKRVSIYVTEQLKQQVLTISE